MEKHDIIVQCGIIREKGDLVNPTKWEYLDHSPSHIHRYNFNQAKYRCRRKENGKIVEKIFSISEIDYIATPADIDIVKESQLQKKEKQEKLQNWFWQPIFNYLKSIS